MTVQQMFNYVRARSNTNAVTAPDSSLYLYANERHRQLSLAIVNAREDYNGEISTTNLVGGQQEYPLPDETMKIKRVEVSYDGSTWVPAALFDTAEAKGIPLDAATVEREFSASYPKVDVYDKSLFLYPAPTGAVTDGIKLWHFVRPQDMSTLSESPSAPKEYHMFLVDLVSLDVDVSRGKISVIQAAQAAEGILEAVQKKVNPRELGKNARMTVKRKNYR